MTNERLNTHDTPDSEQHSKNTNNNSKTETTPESTSETQHCPECNSRIYTDEERGENVCSNCGLVVSEDHIDHGPEWRSFEDTENQSRVGAPTTTMMHDKGLSTVIGWQNKDSGGQSLNSRQRKRIARLRTWDERARTKDSRDRNLKQALGEIERMGSALNLPEQVEETASVIYRKCLKEDLLRGRSIEGVATAALYAAARQCGVPRTLDEFETVCRVERMEISRTYRYLAEKLDLGVEPTNPKDYLRRFASDLDLDEAVIQRAQALLDSGQQSNLYSGRNPVGMAAAALYAAGKIENVDITQREVSNVVDMSTVTIRNRYQELLEAAEIHVEV